MIRRSEQPDAPLFQPVVQGAEDAAEHHSFHDAHDPPGEGGTYRAVRRLSFVDLAAGAGMAVAGALGVKYMVMRQHRGHFKAAHSAQLGRCDSRLRTGGMGIKAHLFAAISAGIPVTSLIGRPVFRGRMTGLTDHTTDIAVIVAVVVEFVGRGAVLLVAVGAGVPVSRLVGGPFLREAVNMGTLGLQDPGADGADLIRGLRCLGTGGMGCLLRLIAAAGAAAEMPVFVMLPFRAVGMSLRQHIAADRAAALVIGVVHIRAFP